MNRWFSLSYAIVLCMVLHTQQACADIDHDLALVIFEAPWSQASQKAQPFIEILKRKGYPIRTFDFDHHLSLARQFRITQLPTYIIVKDGIEIDRSEGRSIPRDTKAFLRRIRSLHTVARDRSPEKKGAVPAFRKGISSTNSKPSRRSTFRSPLDGAMQSRPNPSHQHTHPSPGRFSPLTVSVRVVVDEQTSRAYGSGTIISSTPTETLVLSCAHIFRHKSRQGSIYIDYFNRPWRGRYEAELIASDSESDVSLLKFFPKDRLPHATIAPLGFPLSRGMALTSAGCSEGTSTTLESCSITAINRYLGPPNIECDNIPDQGRSGGGLFTSQGYVIGVCTAADPSEKKGLYAGLKTVQTLLDHHQLSSIYQSSQPSRQENSLLSKVNAREQTIHTIPNKELSQTDIPTRPSFLDHNTTAEVICIIRSLRGKEIKPHIVILDRASRSFLRQLTHEQQRQKQRNLTSLHRNR